MPRFEFSTTPRTSIFHTKNGSYSYCANSRWGPPGSILGPMGPHWVQQMGQNRKKLPCPKIRIFNYPAVIDFSQRMEVVVMAPNLGGDPLGSILGPIRSHWVQKIGQNRRKNTMPKIGIFDYPAASIFRKKCKLRLWHQITVVTP